MVGVQILTYGTFGQTYCMGAAGFTGSTRPAQQDQLGEKGTVGFSHL
jgi:hypothetical protein